ncbi:MAG: MMPL family transporter [Candidatus Magasanikbacteria bacterium]|nr:MMPL family transporter [Candidatus Magasanikbacteria bacterium]
MNNYFDKKDNEILKEELDEAIINTKSSIPGFFVKNFRVTYIILTVIVILGAYAIVVLPKESEPEVKIPYASVSVSYPGANPTDVEELVTDELEEKIKNVENIKTYQSASNLGFSSIFVEFEAEADIQDSIDKLKEAVDLAKPDLPDDAGDPMVSEINFSDFPIVTYSFVGDYSDIELKKYADILQEEFENLPDVSRAPIIGGLTREYQVKVDQNKIASYGLSLSQIASAINLSNFNLPAGDLEIENHNYNIRVVGEIDEIEDLNEIIVTYIENAPIYLKDLAIIEDSYQEIKNDSRIGVGDSAPQNTVSIQIFKKTGGNILKITDNVEKRIDELQSQNKFPEDLLILKTNDNSVYIKNDFERLGSSGLQTVILIVFLLFLVLGIRGSIITGLSVPIAFLLSFIIILVQGMTLNSMVLFAMVLSLGLMVDNSIIVMEGINEYIHDHDRSPLDAALLSIWNYRWPIISGTMTTVGAFLPMLLVSGIIGEYMSILPLTLSATLLASLFVALIIIPTLSAKFYKKQRRNGKTHRLFKIKKYISRLQAIYTEFLRKLLVKKSNRRLVILSAIILLFATLMLPILGIMKIEMFPKIDFEYFVVSVETAPGSTLEETSLVMAEAETIIRKIPELDNYVSNIGQGFSIYGGQSSASGEHIGSIVINLIPTKQRDRKSYEIADSIRNDLQAISSGEVNVEEIEAGPPSGAPFELRIQGDELNKIIQISNQVKKELAKIDGLINVTDSIEETSGEFVFKIDREKAKYYGLDVTNIANTVRQAIYGINVSTLNINGDDVDIVVKYDKSSLTNTNELENIMLNSSQGTVPLRQVATLNLEPSVLSVSHLDGEKVVRVSAQTTKTADLRKIIAEFNNEIKPNMDLPDGYNVEIGGQNEEIEQSFSEMFLSMILAVFLILFILVLQFNSFRTPFVIIFSLPLAIVGAFLGLAFLGLAFSLPAFIGIVSLAGIVVNDSIVLIDRILKNLKRGVEFTDSVIEAGLARMQPIFLTSLTTIVGVLPLALSEEMWQGLGFSIIFGLIFSTVLTLIFIPVVFTSLTKKSYLAKKQKENN